MMNINDYVVNTYQTKINSFFICINNRILYFSPKNSFEYKINNVKQTNKYSHESSLNSFNNHRLLQQSSSILNNGIIIKVSC